MHYNKMYGAKENRKISKWTAEFKQFSLERQQTPFTDIYLSFKLIVVGDTGVGKTSLVRRVQLRT